MTENQTMPQINKLIMNDAINKTPLFDSFKKLCEIQGNENMDYVDFEWKYYQYYHGNRDLNIERSPNNSSPLTFTDLPIDVLENVVEKSGLVDCLTLRKVSPDLRNLVDSTGIHCKNIDFYLEDNFSKINFGTDKITYNQFDKQDHLQTMIADAATFLKNPKLSIGCLLLYSYCDEKLSEFLEFLKSLNSQLYVRSLSIPAIGTNFLKILQLIKPKHLEEIYVAHYDLTVDEFNEVAETEQWKMAKKLILVDLPMGARAEKFLHFKEIDIYQSEPFSNMEMTGGNVTFVRDILLESTHLEHCSLYHIVEEFDIDILLLEEDEEEEYFEDVVNEIMSPHPAYDRDTGRFSIPNSEEYFQFEFHQYSDKDHVQIKRVREDQNADNDNHIP